VTPPRAGAGDGSAFYGALFGWTAAEPDAAFGGYSPFHLDGERGERRWYAERMFVFLAAAHAQELPWECPPITVAADAVVYRDTDGGLEDVYDTLRAEALVYWDDACAWVETVTYGSDTVTTERMCAGAAETVTYTELVYDDGVSTDVTTTIDVARDADGDWTALSVTFAETYSSSTGMTYGGSETFAAAWTGSFADLPDDGWFSAYDAYANTSSTNYDNRRVSTPDCAWSWSYTSDGEYIAESVSAPDHEVEIASGLEMDCWEIYYHASIDGTMVGAVDRVTWERDLADADGDGFVAGGCDCDDADLRVNEGVADDACDGIDADCDGDDRCPDTGGPDTGDTADTGGPDTGDTADTAPGDTADTTLDTGDTSTDTGDDTGPLPTDTAPADAPDPEPSGCAAVRGSLLAAFCAMPLILRRRAVTEGRSRRTIPPR
jgi:hypothetical protein